jgi:hypothetical protein
LIASCDRCLRTIERRIVLIRRRQRTLAVQLVPKDGGFGYRGYGTQAAKQTVRFVWKAERKGRLLR